MANAWGNSWGDAWNGAWGQAGGGVVSGDLAATETPDGFSAFGTTLPPPVRFVESYPRLQAWTVGNLFAREAPDRCSISGVIEQRRTLAFAAHERTDSASFKGAVRSYLQLQAREPADGLRAAAIIALHASLSSRERRDGIRIRGEVTVSDDDTLLLMLAA